MKKKKIVLFFLQKTDEKWGRNFQKNVKHLPFAQKKTQFLDNPQFLDNFTSKLYESFINRYSEIPEKSLISLFV